MLSAARPGGLRRVLMSADTVGGVWTYAIELAAGLQKAGVQTILATMGHPPSPEQRALAAAVPGLVLEASAYRLEWMPQADHDVRRAGAWLLALEERHRPDLVHVNGYAHAALPWRAPCVAVAHSCVLSWWRAVHRAPAPAAWSAYAQAVRRGLAAARVVAAPTASFRREVEDIYGSLPHARVIPNGRDPALFRTGPKEEFVFSAGRIWDEAKNVAALDRVAGELPWPVMVAGEWRQPEGGGEPPRHLVCLERLGPAAMRERLARAPVFALPARYEPFGLSILEAALSGAALVLGDIATLREIWSGAALFVPPDDDHALAAALRRLIAEPHLRGHLAQEARTRAFAYGTGPMVARYLAAYGDALQASSPLPVQAAAAQPAFAACARGRTG